ncbi:MAG: OB-fold nucleic acid binding domain-containing protein, partial [Kiloniellaceae bacterium]
GILKETHGIMIYQEQVMQIAQELAGYSLGGADLLRRAMGKKIKSEMRAQQKNFVEGAAARGVPRAKAERIFEQVAKFAGYGFNKSHAAAYALVAYQTAYLKANYPVEFMAASMTFDMGNTDKLNVFRQDLTRLGIALLPPDINRSDADFRVEPANGNGRAVRYALGAIKNVGEAAMGARAAERAANGRFRSLADFAGRVDAHVLNKRQIENLARAGAFDGLDANRRRVHGGAETIVRHAAAAAGERASAQVNLFGDGGADGPARDLALPALDDWPDMERLRHEFEAIGFYLSAHPLDAHGARLGRMGVLTSTELSQAVAREPGRKRVAGIVVGRQERTSRRGKRFAFVQLSDAGGTFEVVVFAELLARCRDLLEGGEPVLVTIEARGDGDGLRLSAHEIEPLEPALERAAEGLRVFLGDAAALASLKAVLQRGERGRGRVALVLHAAEDRDVELELPGGFRLSPDLRQAIKAIPGVRIHDL